MIWTLAKLVGRPTKVLENLYFRFLGVLSKGAETREKKRLTGCTLYHFQLSPYSYLVRRALVKWDAEIPMKDVLENHEAWLEVTQGGTRDRYPCLKIEQSGQPVQWMYESRNIIRYLKSRLA